jgi:hypothetical protein
VFVKKINWYVLKNIVYFTAVYTIIPTVILWLVQSRHIFELALGSQASILIILKIFNTTNFTAYLAIFYSSCGHKRFGTFIL